MALVVTVGGTSRQIMKGTLKLTRILTSEPDKATFTIYDVKPAKYAEVIITKDGTRIFAGYVIDRKVVKLNKSHRTWEITCRDYTALLFQKIVNNFQVQPDDIDFTDATLALEWIRTDPTAATPAWTFNGGGTKTLQNDGWQIVTTGIVVGNYTVTPPTPTKGMTLDVDVPRINSATISAAGDHISAWVEGLTVKFRVQFGSDGTCRVNSSATFPVTYGQRVRVVVDRQALTANVYLDGVLKLSAVASEVTANTKLSFGDLVASGDASSVWPRIAYFTTDNPPLPAGYVIKELIRQYVPTAAGITTTGVQDGPNISAFASDAEYVGDAIAKICALTKREYDVDYSKDVKFYVTPNGYDFEWFGTYGNPVGTHVDRTGTTVSNGWDSKVGSGTTAASGSDSWEMTSNGSPTYYTKSLAGSRARLNGFRATITAPTEGRTDSSGFGLNVVLSGKQFRILFHATDGFGSAYNFALNAGSINGVYVPGDTIDMIVSSAGSASVYRNGSLIGSGNTGTTVTAEDSIAFGDFSGVASDDFLFTYVAYSFSSPTPAPFNIDDTTVDGPFEKLQITEDDTVLRNRIIVRGGTRQVATVDYSITTDGVNTNFPVPDGFKPYIGDNSDMARRIGLIGDDNIDLGYSETGRFVTTDPGRGATITRSSTTATVRLVNHGFIAGDEVTVSGADQSQYNGTFSVGITDADNFFYSVSGSPATPATGSIRVYTGPLAAGAVITLGSFHQEQVEVVVEDTAQQAILAAAGFSDGIVETVINDESLISNEAAEIRGLAELSITVTGKKRITFDTWTEGFAPGQLVYVNRSNDETVGWFICFQLDQTFAGSGTRIHTTVQLTPFAKEFVNLLAALYDRLRKDARRLIRNQFPDNPAAVAPAVFNIEAVFVDAGTISINWDTDKNCTRRVDYGPTSGLGSHVDNSSVLAATPHSLSITGVDWGTNPTLYFKITAVDSEGNSTTTAIESKVRTDFQAEDSDWRAYTALSDSLYLLTGLLDPTTGQNLRIGAGGVMDVRDALGALQGRQIKRSVITSYFTANNAAVINFSSLTLASGGALPTFQSIPKVVLVNPKNPPSTLEYYDSIQETLTGFTMVALDLAATPGTTASDTSFGSAGENANGSYNATDSSTTAGTGDAIVKGAPGWTIQQMTVFYEFTPPFSQTCFPTKFGDDSCRPDFWGSATLHIRIGTYVAGVFTTRATQTREISWNSDGEPISDAVLFTGLDSPSAQSELWAKIDYYSETSSNHGSTLVVTELDMVGVASDTAVNGVQYMAVVIEPWGN